MEKIKVLVVRGAGSPLPLLEGNGFGSPHDTWVKADLCHLVFDGKDAVAFNQQLECAVLDDPEVVAIYVVLDGEDGTVTNWFEGTEMGFWMYLGATVQTSEDWFAGLLFADSESEAGDDIANVE